jgi:general secretion pathway protein C
LPGGAIVGLPDGTQVSVSVGETIMPGVVLAAVGFDYADVDRQGTRQRLFIDEDKPAETLGPAGAAAPTPTATAAAPTVEAVRAGVSFSPRRSGGGIDGIMVKPAADQATFAAIGFQPGDIIVAVNGARIAAPTDLVQQQSLARRQPSLTVERAASKSPSPYLGGNPMKLNRGRLFHVDDACPCPRSTPSTCVTDVRAFVADAGRSPA